MSLKLGICRPRGTYTIDLALALADVPPPITYEAVIDNAIVATILPAGIALTVMTVMDEPMTDNISGR